MAIVNLDLTGSYGITQGYEWRLHIWYPGNVISSAPWGRIWSAYEPNASLARFSFDRLTHDPALNRTKIPVLLSAFTTRNLEVTGSGFYVYEIRLSLPNRSPKQLIAGRVHVYPSIEAFR